MITDHPYSPDYAGLDPEKQVCAFRVGVDGVPCGRRKEEHAVTVYADTGGYVDPGDGLVDMVNHPPHYNGPDIAFAECHSNGQVRSWLRPVKQLGEKLFVELKCIDVIRHMTDFRLATAVKYIWRVGFGGKGNDREDIEKAIWYLNDWLEN